MRKGSPALALGREISWLITKRLGAGMLGGVLAGTFLAGVLRGLGMSGDPVLAGLNAFAAVSLALLAGYFALGAEGRAIVEAVFWSQAHASAHWRKATGGTPLPRTPKQAAAWLAANPHMGRNWEERVVAWLLVGDVAAARAELPSQPLENVDDNVDATLTAWLVDMYDGIDPPLDRGEEVVASVNDPTRRGHASRDLILVKALDAGRRGGNWRRYLVELRAAAGSEADHILLRRVWPLVALSVAAATLAVTILVTILGS